MIVGIDLGTTNSLISIFRDGATVLIPNALGHFLTPSAVSIADDDTLLVGLAARERLSTNSDKTITGFKRWMGSDHQIALGNRSFRAEELSALVIKSLKADAEAFLGEVITEAVITVPAYFNDAQRRATKTAAELAGLKVERLLNEPTAAGLAYGLQERVDHTTFLVFDLGGGTFDVSVLEYFDGVVEVHASAGDTRLGGEDFVNVLMSWVVELAPDLKGNDKDILQRDKVLWRLAEQAKRDLSEKEMTSLSYKHLDQSFSLTLSRAEYERRCEPLLQRLRKPIERALMDARLDAGVLNEVIMVGGASRMPMVRQLVTRLFARLPLRTINPDETVARGAAIQAALKARDSALAEVVLTDVMPFSLGIVASEEINGVPLHNRFSPIIERNSPVPVSRVRTYSTTKLGQTMIALDVRQGESPIGSENIQLGNLTVSIPFSQRVMTDVQVRFTYDINGLLEVEATIEGTANVTRCLIQRSGETMNESEIASAIERIKVLKIHPRNKQENMYLLQRAKRLYSDLLGDERRSVGHALAQFETVLDTEDERQIRQHSQLFKKFLDAMDKGFVI